MGVGVPEHPVEASVGMGLVQDKHPEEFRTGLSVDHLVVLPDD